MIRSTNHPDYSGKPHPHQAASAQKRGKQNRRTVALAAGRQRGVRRTGDRQRSALPQTMKNTPPINLPTKRGRDTGAADRLFNSWGSIGTYGLDGSVECPRGPARSPLVVLRIANTRQTRQSRWSHVPK
jgi:hypothetical protein